MEQIQARASSARIATTNDKVYNSECVYTFTSPFDIGGLLVHCTHFSGVSEDFLLNELKIPAAENLKGLYVRIVKEKVKKEVDETMSAAPPASLTDLANSAIQDKFVEVPKYSVCVVDTVVVEGESKLGIVVELPFDDTTKQSFPEMVIQSLNSIVNHSGQLLKADAKAFELEEMKPESKYAVELPFVDNGVTISPDPSQWKCEKSGDTENLWLNLSDGFIGGGRKNWDGSGGSNGALDHYNETNQQYPLVVKLGTLNSNLDSIDCYSYAPDEDGPVKVPNLPDLLAKRGINISQMSKTEKTVAEMEVELNQSYAFDKITEEGNKLVPVPIMGLTNLGNSCYLNSTMQILFHCVEEMKERYTNKSLLQVPITEASDDFICQITKLGMALASEPSLSNDEHASKNCDKLAVTPRMFKHTVCANHVEFSTGQQQDAAQFFQFYLDSLNRKEMASKQQPSITSLFGFQIESRYECTEDQNVKYITEPLETILSLPIPLDRAVPSPMKIDKDDKESSEQDSKRQKNDIPTVLFNSCLDAWAESTLINDYRWPHHPGKSNISALNKSSFINFPKYLLVQLQRYTVGADWVPKKLEVNIKLAESQQIDLSSFRSAGGLQDGETAVPEDITQDYTSAVPVESEINEMAVMQLMEMGFSMNGCKRALMTVGGSDVEAAMNWIFEHNQDPDFNDPLPEKSSNTTSSSSDGIQGVDETVVTSLVDSLGMFTAGQVRVALKQTNGAADRAADWLFSHMDDLDRTIAALESNDKSAGKGDAVLSDSSPLNDGDGKYSLVGMISHIGKNTGSGHYVCHLKDKKSDKWLIFNDEKVAFSESPPFEHAYLYLFQRNDSL